MLILIGLCVCAVVRIVVHRIYVILAYLNRLIRFSTDTMTIACLSAIILPTHIHTVRTDTSSKVLHT